MAQAQLGHAVKVAAYEQPHRQAQIDLASQGLPGFQRVERLPLRPAKGIKRLLDREAKSTLTGPIRAADFVHLHGVWEPLLWITGQAARRHGVPYVVTPHGMLDPWSLRQRWLKKRLALWLGYRQMLNGAAFLHTLNADEARLVAPLELRCAVEVIPNGVFVEELEPLPQPGSFYHDHPMLQGRPFILFLGRLHYKKGLDYLAQAFEIVASEDPRACLVVAGPDDGARAGFEKQISRAKLTDRVYLTGSIYGLDKLKALVDAACFCLPSRQEGFSMAIVEAMACGVPVVISDACHFPEVAQVGAGDVVSLDGSAVARSVKRLLGDAPLRDRMGRAGRELVVSRYTWSRIAQHMIDAYGTARVG